MQSQLFVTWGSRYVGSCGANYMCYVSWRMVGGFHTKFLRICALFVTTVIYTVWSLGVGGFISYTGIYERSGNSNMFVTF